MHYLAKLLVEADTAEEALDNARVDAETLIERDIFDYSDFDGRWGESVAYKVDSDEGKQLVQDGMDASRREFDEAMKAIRYMMDNYSDEDIYEENFPTYQELQGKLPEGVYSLSRWQFKRAGGDRSGPYVYSEGEVVDNAKSLASQHKYAEKQLWVVAVDFHY